MVYKHQILKKKVVFGAYYHIFKHIYISTFLVMNCCEIRT